MKNGICMRAVTNSVENELSHHGILGMSWGKRFGPPYPLGGVDKKVARAEAKRKKQQEKRIAALQKAAKKARKAKVKAAKKEKKRLAEEEKIMKKKEELLKRDNYKEIMKNSKYFTTEELKYLKDRHDQQVADKLDRMISKATKITTMVNTIANTAVGFKNVQSLLQQGRINKLEIQKMEQDIANKKQLAESTKNIAEQNKYKAEQEKQKSWQEMHKVTQEYFKGQKEKQSAEADAFSKYSQSYKDFLEAEKTKKEYSDWINQNSKSDRKVYTLKNATVKDILNQRNSPYTGSFSSKDTYTTSYSGGFQKAANTPVSDIKIPEYTSKYNKAVYKNDLLNMLTSSTSKYTPYNYNLPTAKSASTTKQSSTPVLSQVMSTPISDLNKSDYTRMMATKKGTPYALSTILSKRFSVDYI